jgi:hypothetical protein
VNLGTHDCGCQVGIEENKSFVNIFPNPNTSGVLNVNAHITIKTINIYNILGQSVFTKHNVSSTLNYSISIPLNLKGLFLVEILLEGNQSLIKKLLIK